MRVGDRRDWLGIALRGLMSLLVLTLTAVVGVLVALTVNAMSDLEELPWGLELVREYPAPSLVALTVVSAVLGGLALLVYRARASVPRGPAESGGLAVAGGTRTAMVDAPLGESPVVRGRDDVVASLLDVSVLGGCRVRVLSGMGGCGKTTVALAAAQAARGWGWRVWWVSAADTASLVRGMSAVAVEAGASAEEVAGRSRMWRWPGWCGGGWNGRRGGGYW